MCASVHTIAPDKTLSDAVKQMVENKSNSLIVVDIDNKPIGLFSSRTLIKAIVPNYLQEDIRSSIFDAEGTFNKYAEESRDKIVKDFMYEEFHTLTDDDAMIEAATYSLKGSRRIIPVVSKENGVLVGAITRTCTKNALYDILFKKNQ